MLFEFIYNHFRLTIYPDRVRLGIKLLEIRGFFSSLRFVSLRVPLAAAIECESRILYVRTYLYLTACLLFLFTIRLRLNDHCAITMITIGPVYMNERCTGVAEFVNRNSKQAAGLRRMHDTTVCCP